MRNTGMDWPEPVRPKVRRDELPEDYTCLRPTRRSEPWTLAEILAHVQSLALGLGSATLVIYVGVKITVWLFGRIEP